MLIGLVISLIFNSLFLIVVIALFVMVRRSDERADMYHQQWSKWEHEYWMVRSLPQNQNLKLSWIADGKVTESPQEEE